MIENYSDRGCYLSTAIEILQLSQLHTGTFYIPTRITLRFTNYW